MCDLSDDERESIFGRTWGEYNDDLNFRYPDRHENWINIQHEYTLEIRMPRFNNAVQYMKFLKTFKKMFKALDTHYISKGAQNNYNHERNAEKASRKMCAIFCNAYNIVKENGMWTIKNDNDNHTILNDVTVSNTNNIHIDGNWVSNTFIDNITRTRAS